MDEDGSFPHQRISRFNGQHWKESWVGGQNPKDLIGNARLSGKKPFLFSVYLSLWEQMDNLSLMFSYPTLLESTIM